MVLKYFQTFPADKQTLILTGKILTGCDTVLSLVLVVYPESIKLRLLGLISWRLQHSDPRGDQHIHI